MRGEDLETFRRHFLEGWGLHVFAVLIVALFTIGILTLLLMEPLGL